MFLTMIQYYPEITMASLQLPLFASSSILLWWLPEVSVSWLPFVLPLTLVLGMKLDNLVREQNSLDLDCGYSANSYFCEYN